MSAKPMSSVITVTMCGRLLGCCCCAARPAAAASSHDAAAPTSPTIESELGPVVLRCGPFGLTPGPSGPRGGFYRRWGDAPPARPCPPATATRALPPPPPEWRCNSAMHQRIFINERWAQSFPPPVSDSGWRPRPRSLTPCRDGNPLLGHHRRPQRVRGDGRVPLLPTPHQQRDQRGCGWGAGGSRGSRGSQLGAAGAAGAAGAQVGAVLHLRQARAAHPPRLRRRHRLQLPLLQRCHGVPVRPERVGSDRRGAEREERLPRRLRRLLQGRRRRGPGLPRVRPRAPPRPSRAVC